MAPMARRVLIVDDDAGIRDALRMILEYEGYEVLTAPDGKTALGDLERERIDAVLLDIKMPGMDGFEVLDKIAAREPAPPVLMISGHGDIAMAVEATRRGAVDFLEKPPERERILVSLANALSGNTLKAENERLRRKLEEESVLVGASAPMHRDLTEAIREGRFREALYSRLNVLPVRTPPLRERTEDVPELCDHFVRLLAERDNMRPRRFGASALGVLKARSWPGNVRE